MNREKILTVMKDLMTFDVESPNLNIGGRVVLLPLRSSLFKLPRYVPQIVFNNITKVKRALIGQLSIYHLLMGALWRKLARAPAVTR